MTTLIDLSRDVNELTPGMMALRRQLHQHPELSFEEVWTAATLAGRMKALGLAVEEGIGGTGVLAVLEGGKPGKTLLIRSDIDALPMEDATGKVYASKFANRNHACGHDAHATIVAGVAEVLARHRDRIAGRIAFVFQPADEPMRGAQRMIEDGLLERVKPDMSLSVHVLPMAYTGQAVVQTGPIWASRDELTLQVSAPAPAGGASSTFDFARTAAQITAALYDLVENEGQSAENVTFRVRSLKAEQGGPVWLGGWRGEPDQAAIEVNLALYDSRSHPRFLGHQGTLGPDGEPLVDGRPWDSPAAAAKVVDIAGPGAKLVRNDGVERFDVLPLLVATDGAIVAFGHDHRRLRPNLVIGGVEGLAERKWPGCCLRIGHVLIGVQDLRLRCIMTSYDPDTLIQDKDITRDIYRRFDGKLALNCFVIEGGDIAVGDEVQLVRGRACAESAAAAVFAE